MFREGFNERKLVEFYNKSLKVYKIQNATMHPYKMEKMHKKDQKDNR